ncbi:branched-chain amino acid ABC transporter substrate-binding protein [Streptomyces sp. TR06-5]|uniref:branched-chain amino acid ABC transporter substrate-binding protein n=1 Tax=unclassified Streptomyces TaxID=2593676 RepID=UPI0039A22EEA
MRQRSLLMLTTAVTTSALMLTACGSRDASGGGSEGGGDRVVEIGLDAPLTGNLSAIGIGIKNSAELAVKTANKKNVVDGVTFKLVSSDDNAQPAQGQQNASEFIGNTNMVGAVGPLNSDVGQSMAPVFDKADMVQVSPANTNPSLTQGVDWQKGKKERPNHTYFRTSTTDAVQGPYAAEYAYNELKLKKVYVIDDKKTYGAGLAGTFEDHFKKIGGKVAGTDHVNPEDKDFTAIATKVSNSDAEFVYYGGEYPAGAPLTDQIKRAGADIPVIGGDALFSAEYVKIAGKNAEGDLASSVGAPIEDLDTAKEFIANYDKAGYKQAYGPYGGYAYDSTWAIILAVKAVAEDNDGTFPENVEDARGPVTEAMQDVSFEGVTGEVGFDEFGDNTNRQLSIYEVKDGKHVPVETGTFEG